MTESSTGQCYILNTWYIVAEPDELTDGMVARTVMGTPLVIGRFASDGLFALEDRCPHRFVPLSHGVISGESVRCAYHGAQFDGHGKCVHVPGQDIIPPRARVQSFPVCERHGYIWVWLGDPELAQDTSSIPDTLYRSDHPDWDGGYGHFESIRANFNLINDNLFDITHAEFVHPESFGAEEMRIYRDSQAGDEYVDRKTTYSISDRGIVFRLRLLNMEQGGPFYRWMVARSLGQETYDDPIDLDMEVAWSAPGFTVFLLNARPAGTRPADGVQVCNMHALTPESAQTSHYFYRSVKNYGGPELREPFIDGVRAIFEQDKPILEAQQRSIGEKDVFDLRPVSFAGDILPQRARQINRELIAQESTSIAT